MITLKYLDGYWAYKQTSSWWAATLSWQHSCISNMIYKPSKVGRTDVGFGLRSELISRSILLLVSTLAVMIVPSWLTHTHTHTHRQTASDWLYW